MTGSGKDQSNIDININVGSAEKDAQIAGLQVSKLMIKGDLVLHVHGMPGKQEPVKIPALSGVLCRGREDILAEVTTALESGRSALLYGMPGIGKSVLAEAVVRSLQEKNAFPSGMLWISETGFAPVESVCDAIARQLGNSLILQSPAEQKPDLTRALLARYGNIAVILDQVESYQTAGAIAEICQHAGVNILMTSRTHHPIADLDILVPPLPQEHAIELFRDQAHSKEKDDVLIGEICTLLENHPLAILVAARRARAQAMPLEKLKSRLENEKTRLPSLAIDDSQDKKSSVWASLNISYRGLNEIQRRVLTNLAACFGRTTGIELLSKVCGLSEMECEDIVGTLMSRSLVEHRGDQLGLQLLIRDFGRGILGDELPSIQDKVVNAASWYVAQYSKKMPEHFDRLESELGNLLGAIQHAQERQMWETVLAIAEVLGGRMENMLGVRGYWTEALAVREMQIQAAEKLNRPGDAARFRHNVATLRHMRGDLKEASRLYEENVKAFAALDNQEGVAVSLHNLGSIALDQSDTKEARRLLDQSLELKKMLGRVQKSATTLHELGRLAHLQCDFDIALDFYQQSLQIDIQFQDEDGIGSNQQQIGLIRQLRGDFAEAQRLFQSNLDAYRQRGSKLGIASTQLCLGRLAREQGQFDRALELLEESLASSESLGYRSIVAEITFQMGVLYQEQDRLDQASLHYEASKEIYQSLNDRLGIAGCEHKLGTIASSRGQLDLATELLKRAFIVYEAASDDIGMAESLRALGQQNTATGHLPEADEYLIRALDMEENIGNQLGLAHTWFAIGKLDRARGFVADAREHLIRSLEIFERMQSPYADRVRQELTSL